MNSDWSADFRFATHSELKSDIGPKCAQHRKWIGLFDHPIGAGKQRRSFREASAFAALDKI